jgi:hypothetical protein
VTKLPALGVIDAGTKGVLPSADPTAATATGSHSVAADSNKNQVYVPMRGNGDVATTNVCGTAKDVNGNLGSLTNGCIGVFTAPRDSDDQTKHAQR